ncbi:hypothetical protein EHS13_16845 [Paenibacillus psychroresistens]|uniref:Uncharacterized protein n=1 Tax=Paenibacillus psychroresistens TaxID=1778678 RepID=A0A6B8RUA4_9BACL|nr:hypothetical protein EHS13_16845 [Paenibacillus psychroresistens]
MTSEQIKASFETYDIQLSEPKGLNPGNVFLMDLNNGTPETYTINENQLISIYVYSSNKEVKKGLKDFEDKTATASVVIHSKYEIANALLFYVKEDAFKDERVEEIVKGLLVTK